MTLTEKALAQYTNLTISERFYLYMRSHTCPLEKICDAVPMEGRILDVGSGSGIFARMLALQSPQRRILGIEPDSAKVQFAQKGTALTNLSFEFRNPCLPQEEELFDGITVVDVLYLLPPDDQRNLLRALARHLNPTGHFLIKCMDTRRRMKIAWDEMQEFLSVKVLRLTYGQGIHHVSLEIISRWLDEDSGLSVQFKSIDQGYIHPHLLIVARWS